MSEANLREVQKESGLKLSKSRMRFKRPRGNQCFVTPERVAQIDSGCPVRSYFDP